LVIFLDKLFDLTLKRKSGSSLFGMGELESEIVCILLHLGWTAILTQPQRRRETETLTAAGP